jgi:hypothetical protein
MRTLGLAFLFTRRARPWLQAASLLESLLVIAVGAMYPYAASAIGNMQRSALLVGMTCSIAWALAAPRLLLWQRAMRQLRVPGTRRVLMLALTLFALALPGLPLLALALLIGVNALALAAVIFACLAGLAWATGNWSIAIIMPGATFAGLQFVLDGQHTNIAPLLGLLDTLLLLYVAKRWRALLVLDSTRVPCRRLPVALRFAEGGVLAPPSLARPLEEQQVCGGRSQIALDADTSSSSLRICLGRPFAPLLPGRRARTALAFWLPAALALLALLALLAMALLHWSRWAWWAALWFVVPAYIALPVSAQTRLFALFNLKRGGELAELALLPGLGHPTTTRRTLLRATLVPSSVALLAYTLSLIVLALLLAAPTKVLLGILTLGLASTAWLTCGVLNVMAQRGDTAITWWSIARSMVLQLPVTLLALVTTVFVTGIADAALRPDLAHTFALALGLLWALVLAYLMLRVGRDWRRFQRRPHPFLQR